MEQSYDDLLLKKEVGSMDSGKLPENDSDKHELDLINATLDKIKHEWMGEKLNPDGVWVRDENIPKMMNKAGASYLITELNLFNPTSNFGVLHRSNDINERDEIVADSWESVNDVLLAKWEDFGIENCYKTAIMKQFKNQLRIFLSIIENGGMRQYRGDKMKTVINKIERGNENPY